MKTTTFFSVFIIITFTLFNLFKLDQFPPSWPDESLYADVAYNLKHHYQLSSSLWQHFVPQTEYRALWYPPLHFHLVAFSHFLFGFSLFSQRLISLVATSGVLILSSYY